MANARFPAAFQEPASHLSISQNAASRMSSLFSTVISSMDRIFIAPSRIDSGNARFLCDRFAQLFQACILAIQEVNDMAQDGEILVGWLI